MIDYKKYSTAGLFYILCSCWNVYVKEEYKIDDEERDLIKCPITFEILADMLKELFNKEDLPKSWALSCEYMANVMIGSKEWRKYGQ